MLKIHGLKKKFGNFEALRGLDMEVEEGALYGFVGPNGAGKTTAIKIMAGLLKPDEGSVEICGKDDLSGVDDPDVCTHLGQLRKDVGADQNGLPLGAQLL